MGQLWTVDYKLQTWLEVEIAVCEAQAECHRIPLEAVEEIKAKASFSAARVLEIEAEVQHDLIAFLTNVNEYVGEAGRYIHLGLTSSDVIDTALSLQLRASLQLLQQTLTSLIQVLRIQGEKYQKTVMVGRTHGVHAEPITFGFKLAGWLSECLRHQERLIQLEKRIAVGKISGAVGTYANISPEIERRTCARLNLTPDLASTQIISRDRHADYVQTLALLGSSIERFALEIRHLQRTDVLEVEEFFAEGQKGSSAMPHKRNPIKAEQLTGLARLLRGYALASLENIALWHERDISHSSVERVTLPDASIVCHYMLVQITKILDQLRIYPENMARNLQVYGGVIFSQQVLLALVEKGVSREEAYRWVQENAHRAWNTPQGSFQENLQQDPRITNYLSEAELKACLDPERHLIHLPEIFQRLDIPVSGSTLA
jgi:adenylosuccinate lyase